MIEMRRRGKSVCLLNKIKLDLVSDFDGSFPLQCGLREGKEGGGFGAKM